MACRDWLASPKLSGDAANATSQLTSRAVGRILERLIVCPAEPPVQPVWKERAMARDEDDDLYDEEFDFVDDDEDELDDGA